MHLHDVSNKIYKIYIYMKKYTHICVNLMPKCNHNLQKKEHEMNTKTNPIYTIFVNKTNK